MLDVAMFTLVGVLASMPIILLVQLGFQYGVDKDRASSIHLIVWAAYIGLIYIGSILGFAELFTLLQIDNRRAWRAFTLGWLLPCAGATVYLGQRTIRRRRGHRDKYSRAG